ncbi:MAG TPA: Ni/Fe-hydrogenase cytochrome b subunit [Longimicrobium sp.]|nr:Ni/Fe-hydrogenase cytochrome b subunit [Longimicrobium sp.]
MSTLAHPRPRPLRRPLANPVTVFLAVVAAIGGALLAWRFVSGVGAVSHLNDGYPWGIWIAFDVVVGTALATGGYATAILVYVLNRGKYHPLVRSAMLTSALGYTLGAFGVVVDLGRFWNVWKIPLFISQWNTRSILLEVALCILLYMIVLWVEVSPAFLEGWKSSRRPRLAAFATAAEPKVRKALPWVIALGLLLPTMHQSSLGSLMLLAGQKVHPLWSTPLLPLLFLLSCVGMGYSVVVAESLLSTHAFGTRDETPMLAGLATPVVWTLFLYVWIRVIDVMARGRLALVLKGDWHSFLFLFELAAFLTPMLMLLNRGRRNDPGRLFRAAVMICFAGALYRFSTFLIAYNPGHGWRYFASFPEMMITAGLVSGEILTYVLAVNYFPILAGGPAAPRAHRRQPWARAS